MTVASQVWKFKVPLPGEDPWVEMPKGSRLLHVAVQEGTPYLWALVWPQQPIRRRNIAVYATGQEIDGWPDYLGTFHIGWTVWHVFYGGESQVP
jgi:hypothetical protein